jgi:hypothetical protein
MVITIDASSLSLLLLGYKKQKHVQKLKERP